MTNKINISIILRIQRLIKGMINGKKFSIMRKFKVLMNMRIYNLHRRKTWFTNLNFKLIRRRNINKISINNLPQKINGWSNITMRMIKITITINIGFVSWVSLCIPLFNKRCSSMITFRVEEEPIKVLNEGI